VHQLLRILLQVELLFKLIELGPELFLIFLDVDAITLKAFNLSDLSLFLIVKIIYFCIKLGKFRLKLLPFLCFFQGFFPFKLRSFKHEVLLQLDQLLAVENAFLLFLPNFFVKLFQYFVETRKADWVFNL